jgi:uncharacterized protein (TIRG00374 family)
MKGGFFSFLRIAISVTLLGLLFWFMRSDIMDIWVTITRCNFTFILIGLALLVVNVFILAFRLKLIFQGESMNLSMSKALQFTYIGYFFNNFMPTAVGGDIVKAHYAGKDSGKKLQSYASVLMDRFIGLYSFLIVAAVALAVDKGRFQMAAIRPIVLGLLATGVIGFVVITNTVIAKAIEKILKRFKMMRLGERIHSVYSIVHDYRNRGWLVLKAVFVSVAAQSVNFVVVWLFFLSLGKTVSLGNIFLIMPVITFISMLPSLGGLGVREGATVAFFAPLVGKEPSFAVSLLLLLGLFFLSFIGGLVYVWWGIKGKADKFNVEQEEKEVLSAK